MRKARRRKRSKTKLGQWNFTSETTKNIKKES